jgi:hypothetical protein
MKKIFSLATLIFILISGCSTTTSGSWEEPRTANAPYKNMLVVSLAAHDEFRTTVERKLANSISATNKTTASAASSLVAKLKDAPRDRESVLVLVNKIGADSVLVIGADNSTIELRKSQKEKDKYLLSDDEIKPADPNDSDDSWATPSTAVETDILPDTKVNASVRAILYDVADNARPVYTIEVKTKYKGKGGESVFFIADEISIAVIGKLSQNGLIQ